MREKKCFFFLIVIVIFLLSGLFNLMATERPQNIVKLYSDIRKFVKIDNADECALKQLTEVLRSRNLQDLISKVIELYQTNKVIIFIDNSLGPHGAFNPDSKIPTVHLNPKTGISESNLAHELFHAVQIKQGYPTVPKIFKDKRRNVLIELCANIMHVSLTDLMVQSGFSIEEYLRPTLNSIRKVLNSRDDNTETQMVFLRAHYDASVYLRLYFEAKFLSSEERNNFESLFDSKAPIAKAIGKELINIINKYDTHTAQGAILALYESVEFLNNKDLSAFYSDFVQNTYTSYLEYWRKKYPVLQDKK